MADIRMRIGGREYSVPDDPDTLTFGEARDIRRITGSSVQGFYETLSNDPTDGDAMVAFLYVAMRRQDRSVTVQDIERLSFSDIEWLDDGDEDDEAVPTVAAADEASGENPKPETSGTRSSRGSTTSARGSSSS